MHSLIPWSPLYSHIDHNDITKLFAVSHFIDYEISFPSLTTINGALTIPSAYVCAHYIL
jgi:hypothetical protein